MGEVRGSRVAFAAAYLTLVVGLFVALGGTAYATPSPATDQYGDKVTEVTVTESEPQVAGVSVTETEPQRAVASQALPVTGLSLLATAILGAGLVGLGVLLRRRERTRD